MHKKLFCVTLGLLMVVLAGLIYSIPEEALAWPEEKPPASVKLSIASGASSCSGVHIGDGFYLTAAHCVRNRIGNKITDGTELEVLWDNSKYDVALLVDHTRKPRLSVSLACREPIVGEKVSSWTAPWGMPDIVSNGEVIGPTMNLEGRWEKVAPVNVIGAGGSSGGPVFDKSGKLLGLIVAGPGDWTTISFMTTSSAICGLMGRGSTLL